MHRSWTNFLPLPLTHFFQRLPDLPLGLGLQLPPGADKQLANHPVGDKHDCWGTDSGA
jgi:hypothetical protein